MLDDLIKVIGVILAVVAAGAGVFGIGYFLWTRVRNWRENREHRRHVERKIANRQADIGAQAKARVEISEATSNDVMGYLRKISERLERIEGVVGGAVAAGKWSETADRVGLADIQRSLKEILETLKLRPDQDQEQGVRPSAQGSAAPDYRKVTARAVTPAKAADSLDIVGRVFTKFCQEYTPADGMQTFEKRLRTELPETEVRYVYRDENARSALIFWITAEGLTNPIPYWKVHERGRLFIVPEPAGKEQFSELEPVFKLSEPGVCKVQNVHRLIPSELKLRSEGRSWEVLRHGSIVTRREAHPVAAVTSTAAAEITRNPSPGALEKQTQKSGGNLLDISSTPIDVMPTFSNSIPAQRTEDAKASTEVEKWLAEAVGNSWLTFIRNNQELASFVCTKGSDLIDQNKATELFARQLEQAVRIDSKLTVPANVCIRILSRPETERDPIPALSYQEDSEGKWRKTYQASWCVEIKWGNSSNLYFVPAPVSHTNVGIVSGFRLPPGEREGEIKASRVSKIRPGKLWCDEKNGRFLLRDSDYGEIDVKDEENVIKSS